MGSKMTFCIQFDEPAQDFFYTQYKRDAPATHVLHYIKSAWLLVYIYLFIFCSPSLLFATQLQFIFKNITTTKKAKRKNAKIDEQ